MNLQQEERGLERYCICGGWMSARVSITLGFGTLHRQPSNLYLFESGWKMQVVQNRATDENVLRCYNKHWNSPQTTFRFVSFRFQSLSGWKMQVVSGRITQFNVATKVGA